MVHICRLPLGGASFDAGPWLMWRAPKGPMLSSEGDVARHVATIDWQIAQSRDMPPIWIFTRIADAKRNKIATDLEDCPDCRSDSAGDSPCNGHVACMHSGE